MNRPIVLPNGYMLIGYVKHGQMLSDSWTTHMNNEILSQNLFNDLINIMVSLSQIQLPRIGSLTLNNRGLVTLTNRPLPLELQTFENEGIQTIPGTSRYESVEPYLLDLLQCHDSRIYHQPNSTRNVKDSQEQFAALTMMRIISLIDLEWACSPPIELQTPPYWLCGRLVDGIEREHLEVFERRINEFINPFEEQHSNPVQAEIMGSCWKRGSFWYVQAVNTAKGLLRIFTEHILYRHVLRGPLHPEHTVFDHIVGPYWCVGTDNIIQTKLEDDDTYKGRLRQRFDRC
ncbi:predicted protein [Aspergillus terreus NIH2624]|uniref:Aminoglycoside phosphotransferase domain-containing protein n=1 Tax=Aspergillus terreus (strain NIH 2624 / FGSC A1156) TaxID=341663 RepID=Q0CFQ1_ASPTN|nr:uncharacterized protein ATEG_07483 [Aspergillus terreus NIH2624]EAU31745.1 predicted protein [Aspergillus terreus NIH2624]